jgi:hypothetical protein
MEKYKSPTIEQVEGTVNKARIFLEKQKKDLKTIEQDLVNLFTVRSDFKKLRKVVLAVKDISMKDEAFASSFRVFTNLVLQGYLCFIVMGIRRHIKSDNKSISLRGLLERIKNNSNYISKSYFISLYHCEDIGPVGIMANEEELSNEEKKAINDRAKDEVKKMWKETAEKRWKELSGGCESLPPKLVGGDIDELKECVKYIEDLADKYIAHLDKKRKPSKVSLNIIDKGLSKIEEIYKKYSELLTGTCFVSLTSVPQFNDQKFFDEFKNWLVEIFKRGATE